VRLLILGGTVFLGRWLVEVALERGHELTLFNRGRSAPTLFSDVEQLRGDRDGDMSALTGRSWDAVIDTCGFVPRVVRDSAQLLAGAVDHYTFVSSISAYHDFSRPGLTEEAPLPDLPASASEDIERYYDQLKADCEREVLAVFGARSLIVRPGLIVGPHDPTERFTSWVRKLGEPEPVLAPRASGQPVQLIDVRDLAAWIVTLVERRASGAFNATGPRRPLDFVDMLERIHAAIDGGSELVWVDEDRLASAGVKPWEDLPLWLDLPRNPDLLGFLDVDIRLATANGLEFRDLELTAVDTLAWARQTPAATITRLGKTVPAPGLSPERERQLLAQLRT
jgi:2'-hydroxyisoflavone reductase